MAAGPSLIPIGWAIWHLDLGPENELLPAEVISFLHFYPGYDLI